MAWIMSHQELARHPKTRRLARLLDESIPSVIGRLHLFWWWALDYAQDGDLARYDNSDIADATLWEGDPDHLYAQLVAAGFVDEDRTIHDWDDYAGRLIDQRRANADKQRAWRQRQAQHNGHVTVTETLRSGATVQNSTEQYRTEHGDVVGEIPGNVPALEVDTSPNGAEQATPAAFTDEQEYYAQKFPGRGKRKHLNATQKDFIATLVAETSPKAFRYAVDWAALKNTSNLEAIGKCARKKHADSKPKPKSLSPPANLPVKRALMCPYCGRDDGGCSDDPELTDEQFHATHPRFEEWTDYAMAKHQRWAVTAEEYQRIQAKGGPVAILDSQR